MDYQLKDQIVRNRKPHPSRRLSAELVADLRANRISDREAAALAKVSYVSAWFARRGYTYKELPGAQLEGGYRKKRC